MGFIKIQDTGYIRTSNAGTQASSANRANSGSYIPLKVTEFLPQIKKNFSNNPEIGLNTPSEYHQGSLENIKFTLRCYFNFANVDEQARVSSLIDSVYTPGYKLLWYDYSDANVENNNGQLLYRIALNSKFGALISDAEKAAFSLSTNFYVLKVSFDSFVPVHSAKKGMVAYELKGTALKVVTSVL